MERPGTSPIPEEPQPISDIIEDLQPPKMRPPSPQGSGIFGCNLPSLDETALKNQPNEIPVPPQLPRRRFSFVLSQPAPPPSPSRHRQPKNKPKDTEGNK